MLLRGRFVRELPVLHKFVFMELCPRENEFELSCGKRAAYDVAFLDVDESSFPGILRMEVGWIMAGIVHGDSDSEEERYFGQKVSCSVCYPS